MVTCFVIACGDDVLFDFCIMVAYGWLGVVVLLLCWCCSLNCWFGVCRGCLPFGCCGFGC